MVTMDMGRPPRVAELSHQQRAPPYVAPTPALTVSPAHHIHWVALEFCKGFSLKCMYLFQQNES